MKIFSKTPTSSLGGSLIYLAFFLSLMNVLGSDVEKKKLSTLDQCISSTAHELSQTMKEELRLRDLYQTSGAKLPEKANPNHSTSPVSKIAFLKTHKTASTTLGSIYFRYGARNHLRFYTQGASHGEDLKPFDTWAHHPVDRVQHQITKTAQEIEQDQELLEKLARGSSKDKKLVAKKQKVSQHLTLLERKSSLFKKELKAIQANETSFNPQRLSDLAIHHINSHQSSYSGILNFYRSIIDRPSLVSILREPKQHYLSNYYFFREPLHPNETFEQYLSTHHQGNLILQELGITGLDVKNAVFEMIENTSTDLEIETQCDNRDCKIRQHQIALRKFEEEFFLDIVNEFSLLLITERLDESLVVMMLLFNWNLADISYVPLLDSHTKEGSVRWDGLPVKPTPRIDSLAPEIVAQLKKRTYYDALLYNMSNKKLDNHIAFLGDRFNETLKLFRSFQSQIKDLCSCGLKFPKEYASRNRKKQVQDVEDEDSEEKEKSRPAELHRPSPYELLKNLTDSSLNFTMSQSKRQGEGSESENMKKVIQTEGFALDKTGHLHLSSDQINESLKAFCLFYELPDFKYMKLIDKDTGFVRFTTKFSVESLIHDPYLGI